MGIVALLRLPLDLLDGGGEEVVTLRHSLPVTSWRAPSRSLDLEVYASPRKVVVAVPGESRLEEFTFSPTPFTASKSKEISPDTTIGVVNMESTPCNRFLVYVIHEGHRVHEIRITVPEQADRQENAGHSDYSI